MLGGSVEYLSIDADDVVGETYSVRLPRVLRRRPAQRSTALMAVSGTQDTCMGHQENQKWLIRNVCLRGFGYSGTPGKSVLLS